MVLLTKQWPKVPPVGLVNHDRRRAEGFCLLSLRSRRSPRKASSPYGRGGHRGGTEGESQV